MLALFKNRNRDMFFNAYKGMLPQSNDLTLTALVDTDDLDTAWELCNNTDGKPPGPWYEGGDVCILLTADEIATATADCERLHPLASMSVGDVLVSPLGSVFLCVDVGWQDVTETLPTVREAGIEAIARAWGCVTA